MNPVGRGVRAVATRWGVTEGQVYTAVIGIVVALAAAIGGIPPTLADRPAAREDVRGVAGAPRPAASSDEAASPIDASPVTTFDPPRFDPPVVRSTTSARPSATTTTTPPRLAVGAFRVFATVPEPGAPQGIAVAPNGNVLVASNNGDGRGAAGKPALFVYDDDGDLTSRFTVEAVSAGGGIHDLVLPPGGDGSVVYALASRPAAVLRIDVTRGSVTTYATIPDLRTCAATLTGEPCEPSAVDNAPVPVAAAVDPTGGLIVADTAQAIVWRVAPDSSVSVFFKATEFVAVDGLSGVAFAGDSLYVTVAQSATAAGRGVVYRLTKGALSVVAQTDADSLPRGLTVGRSGRLYVALSGAGRVVVLQPDGSTASTLPTDPASTYDTPVRVAFSPAGLMVVEQAPTRSAAGRVIELGVDDAGRA